MTTPIPTTGLAALTPMPEQILGDMMGFSVCVVIVAAVMAVKYLMRK